MEEVLYNLEWMSFNILLACIGVIFGLLFLGAKQKVVKWLLFMFWVLFLPNTVYLLTDLQHIPRQVLGEPNTLARIVIFFQYVVLFIFGVFTFIYGLYPIEKIFQLRKKTHHNVKIGLIVLFNFAIAFGVGLGRIERTHSWYVFTEPMRVVRDVISLATTDESLMFVIGFGIVCNVFYFLGKTTVEKTLRVNKQA
jgi:uncharacterized membrane protein